MSSPEALVHRAGCATAACQAEVSMLSQWHQPHCSCQAPEENVMKIAAVPSVNLQGPSGRV